MYAGYFKKPANQNPNRNYAYDINHSEKPNTNCGANLRLKQRCWRNADHRKNNVSEAEPERKNPPPLAR